MKFNKSILALAIALLPQIALADVIEVFDCNGQNKLAVAKTQTGTTGNVVVNLTKESMPGVVATLKGIDSDITKSTVATDGMLRFDDVKAGKYKLCSATGMLSFRSINIAGTGVAAKALGGAAAIGTGKKVAVAGGLALLAGGSTAIATENSGSNPDSRQPAGFVTPTPTPPASASN
jgi:hypothetical protein